MQKHSRTQMLNLVVQLIGALGGSAISLSLNSSRPFKPRVPATFPTYTKPFTSLAARWRMCTRFVKAFGPSTFLVSWRRFKSLRWQSWSTARKRYRPVPRRKRPPPTTRSKWNQAPSLQHPNRLNAASERWLNF